MLVPTALTNGQTTMDNQHGVTSEDITRFEEDGVVVLRNVISMEWVERMREAMDRALADPGPLGSDLNPEGSQGRFAFETFVALRNADFRALGHESPLAEMVAKLTRSKRVHFLYDFIFSKEPHSPHATVWHQDMPATVCHGTQVAGTWMPLDHVTVDSGAVEYIKGSHHWNRWFEFASDDDAAEQNYLNYQPLSRSEEGVDPASWGESFEIQPDFEAERDKYNIVSFETEPGDIIVNNLLVMHTAKGNYTDRRRRAIGGRWAGDDATFARRQGQTNLVIPFEIDLEDGDPFPPDHPRFPQVWPRA